MEQPATAEVTTTSVLEAKPAEVVETPKEEPKQEDVRAKRFAELSKRKNEIVQRQQRLNSEMKAREDALSKREAVVKEYEEIKLLAKTNPNEAIKKIGTDYKSLTDHILNGEKLTPELLSQDVNEKIKVLEKKLEEQAKTFEEREVLKKQDENKRILENFSATIIETVKNNAEKYPAVHVFDGAPVIYEMIQKRWHDTKGQHLMTIDEAASLLEKDLGGVVEKLLQTPKYASRVNPSKEGDSKPNSQSKPNSLNKPKTITNELTSSAPSLLPPKTENDRIKRALEKLAGA